MKDKEKDKIKVTFPGGAATGVTGSMHHIVGQGVNILLDCGGVQHNNIKKDYLDNIAKFDFNVRDLQCVIISHLNYDHQSRLPLLYKRGFTGNTYITKGSYQFLQDMLVDSARINLRNSKALSKQLNKEYPPAYTEDEVPAIMSHVIEVPIGAMVELDDNFKFQFLGAGHIILSAQIVLYIGKTVIGYTGDIGNVACGNPLAPSFEPIPKADLIIGECTYGDPHQKIATAKTREKDLEKLKAIINNTISQKGKVLIPVFALDRLQNILIHLYNIFGKDPDFKTPVFIDAPLGMLHTKNCLTVFKDEQYDLLAQAVKWSNVKIIENWQQSVGYASSNRPAIILSTGGMMEHGRIMNWLPEIIKDRRNHIITCGYAPEGTLAYKVKQGDKYKSLKINGKFCSNNCGITSLNSFSSHMQFPDLIEYYTSINTPKIVLVHGDPATKLVFAEKLKEALEEKCLSTRVISATNGTVVHL